MATFKGYRVKAGVKWTEDKNSITITGYPKKSTDKKGKNIKYVKYTKTWKNYCPNCKKKGTMFGFGTKGRWFGVEGGIKCKKCDSDYCGVTGRDTLNNKPRPSLKEGSNKTSSTAVKQSSSQNDKKQALSDLKKEYTEKSKPKKDSKLILPPLKKLREGSYIELLPPLVPVPKTYFITSLDWGKDDVNVGLSESVPEPGTTYQEQSQTSTNASTTSAKSTTSVKVSGAKSAIEKKIMLKGAELKNITKIYNWLKTGKGNFSYKFYYNHIKGENINQFGVKSAEHCWNTRKANCVDFAWIFYTMCKGAKIKVQIIHGKATFGDGTTYGHFWNKYNGKIYDASSITAHNYRNARVVI